MQYRIYFLNAANRFCGVTEQVCGDDKTALDVARRLAPTFQGAEVWQGARLVGRVEAPADPPGGTLTAAP